LELKDRAGYVVWGAPNDGYVWASRAQNDDQEGISA
jgi:hypothetical protein